MATNIGIIIILGLLANYLFKSIRLPGILGMLLAGILIGPYGADLLKPELMRVSSDFRLIALVIILLRAGLGLEKDKLKKVGRTAIKLSFIPGLIEGFTIAFVSMRFLGFGFTEGAILGFIVAAVSPAVVVPRMLHFSEKGIGADKGIPTLILAGSSIDDVFAVTMLTSFLAVYTTASVNVAGQVLTVVSSIVIGISIGVLAGFLLVKSFSNFNMRDTKKVLYILGVAILITAIEDFFSGTFQIAGLLGVMVVGFVILEKTPRAAKRIAEKFGKIWIFAEILLFVLIGAQVNIHLAWDAGLIGALIIMIGLAGRSVGVAFSTAGTDLNLKEQLFCIIAYFPKATVQAAVGAIPLSIGMPEGDLILAIAVLSIIITAPLGAVGISWSSKHLLKRNQSAGC